MAEHDGEIPLDESKLIKLAGVGQKTAHVVLLEATGANVMAVDTHVFRVSHRLGLVPMTATTPQKVEEYLVKHIPDEDIPKAHHWLLLHGRYVCQSQKPKCSQCDFEKICPKLMKNSKLE